MLFRSVANHDDRQVEATCTFRVSGKVPELWDPLTGQMRDLPDFTSRDGRTTVPMRFEPAQSFFVIFRKPLAKVKGAGGEAGAMSSDPGSRNFPAATKLAELAGPWNVSFDPKWGGPESVTFETLEDWSKRKEDGIRF